MKACEYSNDELTAYRGANEYERLRCVVATVCCDRIIALIIVASYFHTAVQ
jgi:hypothetical protein